MENHRLYSFWWLWVPVLFMGLQLFFETALPDATLNNMLNEGGSHEIAEFVLLCAAFLVAFCTLFSSGLNGRPWLRGWVALATLCTFYVAGEEMSWGQHILHWSTPEYWQAINDQQETNLHNTSSWLDQKPRVLLEIGVIVGGLLFPLLRKYKPSLLPQKFAAIYPATQMWVIAFFVLAVKIVDKLDAFHVFYRPSEIVELYLFYFVLIYLVILRRRILQY